MKIKAIDFGSYSIKIVEGTLEKKSLVYESYEEIILSEYQTHTGAHIEVPVENPPGSTATAAVATPAQASVQPQTPTPAIASAPKLVQVVPEGALKILQRHFINQNFDGRVISNIPSHMLTSRFLSLPVNSRKKAEMMLPFQLERELPFAINEVHFAAQHFINKGQSASMVGITDANLFEAYFKFLANNKILADILTSELSIVQSFVQKRHIDGPIMILDVGHETTKAYMIQNRMVVANHLSYVGGKSIDENIAKHYQISMAEAVAYKHKHAFFLTDKQFEEVGQDQQEFAKIMKQIFLPLIEDVKKWELGHRVNFGQNIAKIYLCGGSSNLKNICNFLSQALSIKTQLLESFDPSNFTRLTFSASRVSSFTIPHLTAQSLSGKTAPINFRIHQYAATSNDFPSLYSSAYIGARLLALAAVMMFFLLLQHIIMDQSQRTLDKDIAKILQRPSISISINEQKRLQKKPELLLARVEKRKKELLSDLKYLEVVSKEDALLPFLTIHNDLKGGQGWELHHVSIVNGQVSILIKILDELEGKRDIITQVNSMNYPAKKVTESAQDKTITVEYEIPRQ
ncbi:MAG: pilus assembly protein PilM [Oligoflexia bacterium]|nr:pilus assembly protein PilM [Oligoflexia bacterium]MBF0364536.1 pilus assembly protein PilM [Oligoflexia bacterium]